MAKSSPASRYAVENFRDVPLNSALIRFYDSLPDHCPAVPGPFPFVSKSSIRFFSSLFCFRMNERPFFLEIMRRVCFDISDIYSISVGLFPCFPKIPLRVAPVFWQVPRKKARGLEHPVSMCPNCGAWLACRPLSGVVSGSNLFGFSWLDFCLECSFEKYRL